MYKGQLMDGRAPPQLAPWIAGAEGHAFRKRPKLGAPPDADPGIRPVCCGEAWRRVVSKAAIATESASLSAYFAPWQLAIGVQGGAEAFPHAVREWSDARGGDPGRALLDFDQPNAYNTVHREAFLARVQAAFPGLARWLRWCYPVGHPTWVIWAGHIIPSATGGQQGDPLMGLCHGAVQRCIPEALGLAAPWPGSPALIEPMQPPPALDMVVRR